MRRSLNLILFCIYFSAGYSQEFGGTPPSVRWKQVNVSTARIIFPAGLDSQAKRIAHLTSVLNRETLPTIGSKQRKINIVLQNATTISNGYVMLGPFRSEFQLLPQQNSFELGSIPWPDNLAIHEYRHVQQYNNFNRGLSKVFRVFFGQEGQALANALSVPDWFFEGDAVYQETYVSEQGRGRLPFFFNDYRSLWEAHKNYSWMKLRNGSLKDFVPDHYRIGYMLVAYGREKYGADFWKKVTNDAAAFRGLVYPLQRAIRKYSGKSYAEFRKEAMEFFRQSSIGSREPAAVSRGSGVVNEEYPYWMDSSSVVYMRSGFDLIPQFVIRRNGQEQKVRTRDISIDNYFSYRNGRIVYAAFQPDLRWGWRDFSDLKLLDMETGQQRSITHHTKYFAPDISADGKTIVAVDVDEKGNSSLHLLDENGKLLKKVPNPDRLFYTYPKFYSNDKVISAVRNEKGQMSLVIVDMANGSNQYLLPFTFNVIGFPWADRGAIYFSASSNGYDKLYKLQNDSLYALPEQFDHPSSTGDYQLNVSGNKFVWTKFTSSGYRLMFAERSKSQVNIQSKKLQSETTFNITSLNSPANELLKKVPDEKLPVSDYSKSFQLFNFHSRRPYISDPDYSFSFVSENILNTLLTEVFAAYNRNEGYKQLGVSMLYGGWFPVIELGSDYTIDRNARVSNRTRRAYWDEWENRIGLSVPLNLTKGRSFTSLSFGTDFTYNKRYFKGYFKDTFENRAFGYFNNSIGFFNQIQQARKHIYPRLAQSISLNYKIAATELKANQFLAAGSLYLPGFFINHNLVLQGAFHIRDTMLNVLFSNSFPFSRGYSSDNFHRMWKLGANYHLPLVYPDWGFASLVYFRRIRANVFYDFTRIADYNQSRQLLEFDFRSYGTEIYFDTKWWNQLPVSFGVRYSRLLDPDLEGRGPDQWEFVLPMNLLSR